MLLIIYGNGFEIASAWAKTTRYLSQNYSALFLVARHLKLRSPFGRPMMFDINLKYSNR